MGAKFVVFPELAFTTFFPRWWMEDQAEVDRKYFEKSMPSAETQPLLKKKKKLGIGFYIGYAEMSEEEGKPHRFNTSILVGPDGRLIGKYRKVHLPGHDDHRPNVPYQHLEKKYFEVGNLGFNVWKMFKEDVKFFRIVFGKGYWEDMQKDHGYNPPPVWTIAGHYLAELQPGPTSARVNGSAMLDGAG